MTRTQLQDDAQRWWRTRLLGRVYNHLGYLDLTGGHFNQARKQFLRALPYFADLEIGSEQANTLNNLAFTLATLGPSEAARAYVDESLKIRQKIGRHYPVALSLNTRGIIEALHDHGGPAENSCAKALRICEALGQQRGVGLACIGVGYALRKRGNQWRQEELTHRQAAACFSRADVFFARAIGIFNKQVDEPARLWEAENERGSLYCDWGWLTWKGTGNERSALDKYKLSTEYQKQAVQVAEKKSWPFQIADSNDDLAQVYADRGFLLAEMGKMKEAAESHVNAESCLKAIEKTVPDTFWLTRRGFRRGAEPGEAHLLSLGKVHLQRGIWIFRQVEQQGLAGRKRNELLSEGVRQFAIATAYLERYWPKSYKLDTNLTAFDKRLRDARVPAKLARAAVKKVVSEYNVRLDSVFEAIDNALGVV